MNNKDLFDLINILHVKPEEWLTCLPDKPKNKAQQLNERLVASENNNS